MTKPEISVIMAAYNTEKYLDVSIKSILNQTFSNFELIIINDASKDNSLNIIDKYQKIDKRIQLLNNRKNIGPAASRNRGLKIARGKFIAILDADDISLPRRLETQHQFLEDHPDIFLCGSGTICIDESGNTIEVPEIVVGYKLIETILPRRNCIAHSSIMFRNNAFFYREKFVYSHDYDFYLILLSKGLNLENLEDRLVKYRTTSGNITFSKKNKQDLFAKTAKDFYNQRLKLGKDDYDLFEPSKILTIKDLDPESSLLKYKMGICLQNREFNNAKTLFSQYKKLNNTCFIELILYSLMINQPYVYELYQKLRHLLEKTNP